MQDIKLLMHELLLSPLTALPEAFMSTLAEMWMNWVMCLSVVCILCVLACIYVLFNLKFCGNEVWP